MMKPNRSFDMIRPFPGCRNGCSHQQHEVAATHLAMTNNQLVDTLERLSDAYRALLVGERITDAERSWRRSRTH
jgi:hypothetical protein